MPNDNLFSDWILQYVESGSIWGNILALLLVTLQAVLLNGIINQHKMTKETTYYPALFYVLLASAIPDFLYLSPVVLAATFYIIALSELFKWYKNYEAATQIFNVGFWLSIASLFFFPVSIYFWLALIGLSVLRSLKVNEFFVLLIGFLVPYFLIGVYFFWIDQLPNFMYGQVFNNFGFFSFDIKNETHNYVKIGFFVVLVIWVLIQASQFFVRQSIQNQKNVSLLLWSIAITFVGLFAYQLVSLETLMLLAVPLSYFLSVSLLNMKQKILPEAIHVGMLILVFCIQYKEYVWDFFFLE